MTRIQPFANYAEALDFSIAETFRALNLLACGDVVGSEMLRESAERARLVADRMHEAACR